jgi:signal transduction histidine kinase
MDTEHGTGWAVGSIDGLGEGPGFRKIRSALGVTAFGVNAIVLPPGFETNRHYHERQLTGAYRSLLGLRPDYEPGSDVSPRFREFFAGVRTQWEADGRPGLPAPAPVSIEHTSPPQADRGNEVELTATYEDALPMVNADPERVAQLLSNLVGNALKFTPAGGHVEVRAQPYGEGVLVSVTDDGEGIPSDQLPHVFDRFFQVSSPRIGSRHGAGLGLPIARGIVEAHGGTIWIESAPGRGTTVRFTLPPARGE